MRGRLEESAQDRHLSRGLSEAREKALGEGVPNSQGKGPEARV